MSRARQAPIADDTGDDTGSVLTSPAAAAARADRTGSRTGGGIDADLLRFLKRLKLGALALTLPERLSLARAQHLDYVAFLTLLLADEVQRRDNQAFERRLDHAGFEERVTLDHFDWSAPVQVDRRHVQELFTLEFLARKEHVLLLGPVGVGKTFFAQALGAAAVRARYSVLFTRADSLLRELAQARADHTLERVFRRYLTPSLLIVDDFGLHRLTAQQSSDLYDLIVERHRRSSFIVTSNRAVDEWLGLWDDPILGNSALDRLANGAHQLVIEGPSYRAKLAPRRGQTSTATVTATVTATAGARQRKEVPAPSN